MIGSAQIRRTNPHMLRESTSNCYEIFFGCGKIFGRGRYNREMRVEPEQAWGDAGGAPALPAGTVHVWRATLALPDTEHDRARALLGDEERARADRFLRAEHGRRFTAARAALRRVLAGYLGRAPEDIPFAYTDQRKPFLPADANPDTIQFNLSHSGDVALIGVTRGRAIGVDVEHMAPLRDWAGVAKRYFAPEEAAELAGLPDKERLAAFYRCWTRKEAYLKALGDGLTRALDSFRVTFAPDEPPALAWTREGEVECARWVLAELRPAAGYVGAVAVEGPISQIRLFSVQ